MADWFSLSYDIKQIITANVIRELRIKFIPQHYDNKSTQPLGQGQIFEDLIEHNDIASLLLVSKQFLTYDEVVRALLRNAIVCLGVKCDFGSMLVRYSFARNTIRTLSLEYEKVGGKRRTQKLVPSKEILALMHNLETVQLITELRSIVLIDKTNEDCLLMRNASDYEMALHLIEKELDISYQEDGSENQRANAAKEGKFLSTSSRLCQMLENLALGDSDFGGFFECMLRLFNGRSGKAKAANGYELMVHFKLQFYSYYFPLRGVNRTCVSHLTDWPVKLSSNHWCAELQHNESTFLIPQCIPHHMRERYGREYEALFAKLNAVGADISSSNVE